MTMAWKDRVLVVAAAGTGGHIFPALAVADHVAKKGAEVHWMGTNKGMEKEIIAQTDYTFHAIHFFGFLGKGVLRWFSLFWELSRAFWQCSKFLKPLRKNSVLLVMGGYISVPAVFSAKLLGIPIVMHEQNARAGMANRCAFYFAKVVCQAFDGTFLGAEKVITTGNPLRESIKSLTWQKPSTFNAKRPLKILVFGGSLGATVFNEIIPKALQSLIAENKHIHCLLQCGRGRSEAIIDQYSEMVSAGHLSIVDFIDEMMEAYRGADIVISRSGAMTISELAKVRKPAILVPFPHATHDHQSINGAQFQKSGGGWLIQQKALDVESLTRKIIEIYDNPVLLESAHLALGSYKNSATEQIDELCLAQANSRVT